MSQIQVPTLSGSLTGVVIPAVVSLSPSSPPEPNPKRFVIVHTVDIPADDLVNFQGYGTVVQYDYNVEAQIHIDNLVFDYLMINLRDKQSRSYFDLSDLSNYNVIGYISFVEQFDSYVESLGCSNVLTTFPAKTHFKALYDTALLQTTTDSPSKCLSVINYLGSFLGSLKKTQIV